MVKPTICNSDAKTPVIPEFCDDGLWEVPVSSLSDIKTADRDHAYILPDDSVWVLSYDGKQFIQLNLAPSGDGQPTQITNTDGFISVEGSGTHNVSIDLDGEKMNETFQGTLTAGKNIIISTDNTISARGINEELPIVRYFDWDSFGEKKIVLRLEGDTSKKFECRQNNTAIKGIYQSWNLTTEYVIDLAIISPVGRYLSIHQIDSGRILWKYDLGNALPDWNNNNPYTAGFIRNKPEIPDKLMAGKGISINKVGSGSLSIIEQKETKISSLNAEFDYAFYQNTSLNFVKLDIKSAMNVEAKSGSIVEEREVISEKLTALADVEFFFDVVAKNAYDGKKEMFTLSGTYGVSKIGSGKFNIKFIIDGMYKFEDDIPSEQDVRLTDENNILFEKSKYDGFWDFRQKTLYL